MRQGQQNRRGRGRNNGGGHRKGHQNPLTRSFESNGPDVKLRGTPAHIAEKYMSLARDAQSSGDPVLAENYLQHAEHYNRIIMSYREQQVQQSGGEGFNGGMPRPRPIGESDEFGDDDGGDDNMQLDPMGMPMPVRGQEPQPPMFDSQQPQSGVPQQGYQGQQHQQNHYRNQRYDDRQHRRHNDQGGRHQRDRFNDQRGPREHREFRDQQHEQRPAPQQMDRIERAPPVADVAPTEAPTPEVAAATPRIDRAERPERAEGAPRRRERFQQAAHEQPEFLRRPVRRPRRERDPAAEGEGEAAPPAPSREDNPQE